MHILVGVLLLACGLVAAVFAPRLATFGGTRAGRAFTPSNVVAFRVIGSLIALAGALYACGIVG
ncbi:hypothetical protein [Streptomyces sp. NBC_00083]|uniref:hypothetical protein n=1 Tax=Streptomyces sp. NBC_00083 TaxID=2975647 RepID=UPI0022500F20|nr:hypothetical protein [Streptomyces sp. NBC_00083]MCX5386484.1 hypothetical protein [Streptomyces sp. NBC_00083]